MGPSEAALRLRGQLAPASLVQPAPLEDGAHGQRPVHRAKLGASGKPSTTPSEASLCKVWFVQQTQLSLLKNTLL